jgi:hypothetical protein
MSKKTASQSLTYHLAVSSFQGSSMSSHPCARLRSHPRPAVYVPNCQPTGGRTPSTDVLRGISNEMILSQATNVSVTNVTKSSSMTLASLSVSIRWPWATCKYGRKNYRAHETYPRIICKEILRTCDLFWQDEDALSRISKGCLNFRACYFPSSLSNCWSHHTSPLHLPVAVSHAQGRRCAKQNRLTNFASLVRHTRKISIYRFLE